MGSENPFVANLDQAINDLIVLATEPKVLDRVEDLPPEGDERIERIRETLRPSELVSAGVQLPDSARIVPRWFEDGPVAATDRYIPRPGGPRPPIGPQPTIPGTVCVSVGVVVCGSVGG